MTPKVSVVVPNYNYARYLDRRLGTILSQTFRDFELIYLDDGSTDESAVVAARHAGDPRFRGHHDESNGGSVFRQWNRGAREARGEYLWFAEADDWSDPRFLEELVLRLDRNPSAGLAYCQSWCVDASGAVTGSCADWTDPFDAQRWRKDFVNEGRDECLRFLLLACTLFNASAVLVRRSAFERAGGADESFRLAGDWITWLRILAASDLAFVAEPLNWFRMHEGTVRSASRRDGIDVLENYRVAATADAFLEIPDDVRERVSDRRMSAWLEASRAPGGLAWSRHLEIRRAAAPFDRRLHRRLLRETARRGLARTGLLMPALAAARVLGLSSPTRAPTRS